LKVYIDKYEWNARVVIFTEFFILFIYHSFKILYVWYIIFWVKYVFGPSSFSEIWN